MQQIVIAQLLYHNPKNGEEYTVVRHWPCKDRADAELIVNYYGRKTGAFNANIKIEEIPDEEIKSTKTTTITAQTHQTQPIA